MSVVFAVIAALSYGIVALCPAPTILLAMGLLRERPTRRQGIGLVIAGTALVAIGAGS